MIKHALQLVWKRKGRNAVLIIEILLAFLILFSVLSLLFKYFERYFQPLGFAYKNVGEMYFDNNSLLEPFYEQENNRKVGIDFEKSENKLDTVGYMDLIRQTRQNMLSVKGINAVAYSTNVTAFNQSNWSSGTDNEPSDENPFPYDNLDLIFTSEHYAEVFQPTFNQGRWYGEEDLNGKYLPIVVNQAFVDVYGRGETDFVGKHMNLWGDLRVITGVVDAFKYKGEFDETLPLAFPYIDNPNHISMFDFTFDNKVNPNWEYEVNEVLRNSLKGISFTTYKLDDARWQLSRQYWAPIAGLLALCTFLIFNVGMGLFGALQYNIKKRRGEIGLRKSIGATNGQIRGQFVTETLLLAGFGLLIGLLITIQIPLLNLFDIKDSTLYIGMGVSLLIVLLIVLLASLIPSMQASKIQPAVALHEE